MSCSRRCWRPSPSPTSRAPIHGAPTVGEGRVSTGPRARAAGRAPGPGSGAAAADRGARRSRQPAGLADAARAIGAPPGSALGTELAQLRPYEIGDDVRHIDPAATARTGSPHVRLHVPERALTTWIVLDVSPSMAFGTALRLKADVAEGVALVFGRLGRPPRRQRRAGRVRRRARRGCCRRAAPSRGWSRCGRLLAEGVAPDGRARSGGAGAARCGASARLARQPGLVVVDLGLPRAARRGSARSGSLRVRHSVLAVEIADPREAELPAVGHLRWSIPRPATRIEVDTSRRRVRERFAELERERRGGAWPASSAACASTTWRSRPKSDWLLELGRQLR